MGVNEESQAWAKGFRAGCEWAGCDGSTHAPSLTPEEMDRMRLYHATKLDLDPGYLAELGVGEDRWTRRDLAAVDAWNDEQAARAKRRRRVLEACVAVASFAAGSGLGLLITRGLGL